MKFEHAKWIWLVVIAGFVVGADQLTKWQVREHLATPVEGYYPPPCDPEGKLDERTRLRSTGPVTVIDGYFHLRYVENCGGAFGFLSGRSQKYRRPFFFVTSLLATAFLIYLFVRVGPREKILMVAFSVILGGAVGNLIDRFAIGYVVDFVEWHIRDRARWPTFNIADVGITVGLVLILIDSFFLAKRREQEGKDEGDGGAGSKGSKRK
jgi:signal peptidase II